MRGVTKEMAGTRKLPCVARGPRGRVQVPARFWAALWAAGLLAAAAGVALQGSEIGRLLSAGAQQPLSASTALSRLLACSLAGAALLTTRRRTHRFGLVASSAICAATGLSFARSLILGQSYGCGCSARDGTWALFGLFMAALVGLLLSECLRLTRASGPLPKGEAR